jgi:hypothetical protein
VASAVELAVDGSFSSLVPHGDSVLGPRRAARTFFERISGEHAPFRRAGSAPPFRVTFLGMGCVQGDGQVHFATASAVVLGEAK